MTIISFGQLQLSNIYPFVVSFLYVARHYIFYLIKTIDKKENNPIDWNEVPWFFSFLMLVGETFNGILDIVSHYLMKPKAKNISLKLLSKIKIKYLPAQTYRAKVWKLALYLYISSSIEAFTLTGVLYISSNYDPAKDFSLQMRIFNLFFIVFITFSFLKTQIYLHQIISCLIVSIGIILFLISKQIFQEIDQSLLIHFGVYCGIFFIFSMREVFQKWLMEIQQIRPVRITFVEGFFGIINMSIGITIYDLIYKPKMVLWTCITNLVNSNWKMLLLFIVYIILSCEYGFFAIYTKYVFSPAMMPIAYAFTIICWEGILQLQHERIEYLSYLIPGYFLLFLGCLIYNEIIIIYVPKVMCEYTKQEILKRSKEEISGIIFFDPVDKINTTNLSKESE